MPYYLRKNLPTVKAGAEMEMVKGYEDTWVAVKKTDSQFWQLIPPEVLNDWIEERDGRWIPAEKESYFYPSFCNATEESVEERIWKDGEADQKRFSLNLVCKTHEEARALALRMLNAIKK